MSKKKFKKKKDKKRSQSSHYVASKPNLAPIPVTDSDITEDQKPKIIEGKNPEVILDPAILDKEKKEFAYVRSDVKKIVIIMSSIIALLIIVFILNSRTTIFNSMGDWLYNSLNIQTQ